MKNLNNQNGFTLIEVIVALFILTIGILGVATMQVASINGNSSASELSEAAAWGGDTLETLMGRPYNDDALRDLSDVGANAGVTGLDNTDVVGSPADGGPIIQDNHTVFWNVADDFPVFGTKTIRVLLQRNDRGILKTISQDFIKMEPI